jgi:hypothetical protein
MPSRFLIAALASTVLAGGANAATFFTDAGAFGAATSGLTNSAFASIAPSGNFATAPSYTLAGVTFDNANTDFLINGSFFGTNQPYGGATFYSGQFGALTTISFAGATAFGIVYGSYNNAGSPISFTLSDNSVFTTTMPGTVRSLAFFGFTSTTPITSITVNNQFSGSQVFDVVSLSIGSAAVVPEPQSWALLIAGFGLVGAAMRRRRAAIA